MVIAPLAKTFRDGVPGDLTAADLNLMASTINQLIQENTQLRLAQENARNSQLVFVGTRTKDYTIPPDGRAYPTQAWTIKINPEGWIDPTDTADNPPIKAPGSLVRESWYEIKLKTLISVNSGSYPRFKAQIFVGGVEVAIAEDNLVREGTIATGVSDDFSFRKTILTFAVLQLKKDDVISVRFSFWNPGSDAAATVAGSEHTMLTIRRDATPVTVPAAGGGE